MPPTRRKAPFWSPRASDTHSTNAWVPPKWAESISGAETMRISSGANTSESRDGFRSCMTHAPKKTPIKKRATAEKWLQCGWKCKRHGELAESGCLISVEGVPFSREEPQYKHKEYGQQCAHKAADIHDLYLSFRLKLHFRAKPQNHRVMSSTADVRVILDNGLEEKHRQGI